MRDVLVLELSHGFLTGSDLSAETILLDASRSRDAVHQSTGRSPRE